MRIMVLGGGGREHAIVHAFSRSKVTTKLHCCPGNPGIAKLAACHAGNPSDPFQMTALCKRLDIDLVFIGPEAPLVAGTADALRDAGILVMGPGKLGAQLEGSKVFSKNFMKKHGIPTSSFDCCQTIEECAAAIGKRSAPYVVKADGLAAGKGAFLLDTKEEAMTVCSMMLDDMILGAAGKKIIIEDFVEGQEMTILAITDGETVRILPSSQDHKRALDGDKGSNTGGMGAYSPVPWVDDAFLKKVEDTILMPTLEGLKKEGIPFCGVIYAGIMIKPDGSLSVLEYNVRLGDPEAQVVLPVFGGDFGEAVFACCKGDLAKVEWPAPECVALGVVMASGGYPDKYQTGYEIVMRDEEVPDTYIYHAGTAHDNTGTLVTSGGRVLTVVGMASTLKKAKELAYRRVNTVYFRDAHYRKDIGDKSLKGEDKQ
ncbi:MAG TPA: phosphoribosylamine--glycine ligase [Synergistaceae bacterium]|jgi:phosphoribosylamine--glycine ligase|nr:phosphoribosylamine--glycine ligase [Synergistaceae bacterium]NLL41235.1 phosphoribosylamine--glycine ligase [Synergistaceae bacterium]HPX03125.1 phosphoribosylamine--glycine ligase [Synergistaceae bacterium]HQA54015.1 phosphoribosylamine--glycine ligase [Synergistaceae bacterium]